MCEQGPFCLGLAPSRNLCVGWFGVGDQGPTLYTRVTLRPMQCGIASSHRSDRLASILLCATLSSTREPEAQATHKERKITLIKFPAVI